MKKAFLFFALTAMSGICAIVQNPYVSTNTNGYCASVTVPLKITAQLHGYSGPVSRQWKQKIDDAYQNIPGEVSDTLSVTSAGTYGIVYSTPAGSTIAFSNGVCVTECTTVPLYEMTFTGRNADGVAVLQYGATQRSRFFLMKSYDGREFVQNELPAMGTTYSEPLTADSVFYQLRAIPQEGAQSEENFFSPVLFLKKEKLMQPTQSIDVTQTFNCIVYDMQGRKLKSVQSIQIATNAIGGLIDYVTTNLLNEFPRGIYIVQLVQGKNIETHQVFVSV